MRTLTLFILLLIAGIGYSQKHDSVAKYDTNDLNRRIKPLITEYNRLSKVNDSLTKTITSNQQQQTFLVGVIKGYEALKDEQKGKKK